jgi:protein required for attachment to host cells
MTTTWVVVAHRAGARIFEHRTGRDIGHELLELRHIDHADGRKKSGELDSDRSGATFTGQRGATGNRAMGQQVTSHEHAATTFAKSLADELRTGRMEHKFEQLLLVAEPHFLGMIEGSLDAPTAKLVSGTLNKDYAHVPGHEMYERVRKQLPL